MKTLGMLVALATVSSVLSVAPAMAQEDEVKALALGAEAPMADVAMKNVDGKDVTIASVKGNKGTLVMFACNHCPWVKAWETRMVELGNAYKKRGIGVIAINANDPGVNPGDGIDEMKARARLRKMSYPYVVDATSDVARAFGATRTPEVFLFDPSGKLVYHGAIDDNAKEPAKVSARWLRDALDAVVAGKAVPTSETKALGCSIKFRKASSTSS